MLAQDVAERSTGGTMKDFEWVSVEQEAPPEHHWYDVLRKDWLTSFLYETLARWNGADWLSTSEHNVSDEIKYWKKKGR